MPDPDILPGGGAIRPRHPTFDLGDALARDWNGGHPFRTAFFNAMSLSFPSGERFFIDAVRAFEDEIRDPALREDIRGFIGQEAVHRRVHQTYNETLCRQRGYDLQELEAPFLDGVAQGRENLSPIAQLTVTVALEHLTATLASALLRDPRGGLLAGADPRVAAVWLWHAVEESEHKAVAFDVYRTVGGCPKRLRRALRHVTLNFLSDNFRAVRTMFRHDGHGSAEVAAGVWHLFGWPGMFRRLVPEWAGFLRRRFDPRGPDDQWLLDQWNPDPAVISFAPGPARGGLDPAPADLPRGGPGFHSQSHSTA